MNKDSFDTLDGLPTIRGGDGAETKLLADRYKVLRKLGEGGMGLVYLAEDTELDNNKVAIKFIPPMLAGNVRAIKNLKKEAQTAMQLSHSNIVRLHDLHTDGHQKFLVMEYIEGKTLEELLAEKEDDKFTLEELVPIAEQIAAGLDYAHSRNVLHRDLKPSNIMIGKEGAAKLMDFGIAREIKDSHTRVTGQETSGTLPYMSPEQLMGEEPTVSMDIYSLGALLYECLSGHPPFYRGDIREQIKSKTPGHIKEIDESASQAIRSALAKKAADRPKNTSEFIRLLKGEQVQKSTKAWKSARPAHGTTAEKSETLANKKHGVPDRRCEEQLGAAAGAIRSVEIHKAQQEKKAQSKSTYYSDKQRNYIVLLVACPIAFPLYLVYCYLLWPFWLIAGGWVCLARHHQGKIWLLEDVDSVPALVFWPFWILPMMTILVGAILWVPACWAFCYYFLHVDGMAKDMSLGDSIWTKPILIAFDPTLTEPKPLSR